MAEGDLSRERMEEVINSGGSVMINGQIISSIADLPDTEESIAAAEQELEARKEKASKAKTDTKTKGK